MHCNLGLGNGVKNHLKVMWLTLPWLQQCSMSHSTVIFKFYDSRSKYSRVYFVHRQTDRRHTYRLTRVPSSCDDIYITRNSEN